MTIPRATLRLQFHRDFTFDDAQRLIDYFDALNISHLYASPILKARAGSKHGYDVIDPTQINPELGGEDAFRRLAAALRARGMGIIVDIVPNHMAVGGDDNQWWLDVLQNGRLSPYSKFFDIDWDAEDPNLRGKLLAPFLGQPYASTLSSGEMKLTLNADAGRFEVRYFQHVFPIADRDQAEIERRSLSSFDPSTEAGRQSLHELLERQHFRLAWWKVANDAINWRRFFDITALAALRCEDVDVFDATHAKIFRLYAEGLIDGVRIDHVDGLSDPGEYCRRLRARFEQLASQRPHDAPAGIYIIVEKILGPGEELRADWGCDGTTGYDFMDQVARVLHDARGEEPLTQLWQSLSGRPAEFAVEEDFARRELLKRSFAAQLEDAVRALYAAAERTPAGRDIARPAVRRALIEILVHMRVYRTYARIGEATEADRRFLKAAVDGALRTCLPPDRGFVGEMAVLLDGAAHVAREHLRPYNDALRKFQQISAPLAAKAVEDTAFYRYGALLSRLDVGFNATSFGGDVAMFHRQNEWRAAHFPNAMLSTSTHDHKRGEDMRARLAVLSEIPDLWQQTLCRWIDEAAPLRSLVHGKVAPSNGDVSILFQTIVGAWPYDLSPADSAGRAAFAERLSLWQQKAMREAKLETDWAAPNEAYENAARTFLFGLMRPDWAEKIAAFAQSIANAGAANGLSQTLLKLCSPGVPDLYQGTEFWDLSLVDPDNRRPVDFASRVRALADDTPIAALAGSWRDGRIKQAIISRALACRRRQAELFARGGYAPIEPKGDGKDHVIAFARQHKDTAALIVVSRLSAERLEAGRLSASASCWGDTALTLPERFPRTSLHDVFTQRILAPRETVHVASLLNTLPVALFVTGD